ncbi:MAG TPA: FixG Ig-like domain-containing protein, partial [Spongiibacteraceae bacterium]|nr:FixG Ig-like domain-containing protein [Spongiibacteraceae bacterium]
VINMDERPHRYLITSKGLDGATLTGNTDVSVDGGEVKELALRITIDPALLNETRTPIKFTIDSEDTPRLKAAVETGFFGPRTH